MPQISKGYGLDHAYKFYKKKHKDAVDKKLYRTICYDLNKMISADVVKGKMVQLPHRMGHLWIKKYMMDYDNPPVDLNASRNAGEKIYHLNWHSDGYIARWAWKKLNSTVTNLIYYSFHATRANKREVPKIMNKPGGHKQYFA